MQYYHLLVPVMKSNALLSDPDLRDGTDIEVKHVRK